MKTLAFIFGLFICIVGVVGIIEPSVITGLARHFNSSGSFYVIGVIRIAFGIILISATAASRFPKTIRILGIVILILGISTAITGFVAMDRANAAINWWLEQGSGVARVTCIALMVLGGFVAYACAPRQASAN